MQRILLTYSPIEKELLKENKKVLIKQDWVTIFKLKKAGYIWLYNFIFILSLIMLLFIAAILIMNWAIRKQKLRWRRLNLIICNLIENLFDIICLTILINCIFYTVGRTYLLKYLLGQSIGLIVLLLIVRFILKYQSIYLNNEETLLSLLIKLDHAIDKEIEILNPAKKKALIKLQSRINTVLMSQKDCYGILCREEKIDRSLLIDKIKKDDITDTNYLEISLLKKNIYELLKEGAPVLGKFFSY